jgi:hypothetical protein
MEPGEIQYSYPVCQHSGESGASRVIALRDATITLTPENQ